MHGACIDCHLCLDIVPYNLGGVLVRRLVFAPGAEGIGDGDAAKIRLYVDNISFRNAHFVPSHNTKYVALGLGANVLCDEVGIFLWVLLFFPARSFQGRVRFLKGTHLIGEVRKFDLEVYATKRTHRYDMNPSNKIITLDGNIGVGKSTFLELVRAQCPEVLVVQEPVDMWANLKNEKGESLLELFYKDKRRWSYTFQNAAVLTRVQFLKEALAAAEPGKIILTERSVLTDRHVFAALLRDQGYMDDLEGSLYDMWFDTFAKDLPVAGIVYITTSPTVAAERIQRRGRDGEQGMDLAYLNALNRQHQAWISTTSLPVLELSTEDDVDVNQSVEALKEFFKVLA